MSPADGPLGRPARRLSPFGSLHGRPAEECSWLDPPVPAITVVKCPPLIAAPAFKPPAFVSSLVAASPPPPVIRIPGMQVATHRFQRGFLHTPIAAAALIHLLFTVAPSSDPITVGKVEADNIATIRPAAVVRISRNQVAADSTGFLMHHQQYYQPKSMPAGLFSACDRKASPFSCKITSPVEKVPGRIRPARGAENLRSGHKSV